MAGCKIPKRKDMSIHRLSIYQKPEKVFIPLISGGDTNLTLLVKENDYVLKGSVVAHRKNFGLPIFSSVSGKVVGFEEKTSYLGEKVKCVVIENDFKEETLKEYKSYSDFSDITKDIFLKVLKEKGIIGMGGAGFPSYIKYQTDTKIKKLIVNAVECEPYITADYTIIQEKCDVILEMIDAIVEIFGMEEAIIAIKKNSVLDSVIHQYIGTYPKIKLQHVPNIYPMGWERLLIEEVTGETYDKLPIEKGIVVNNVSTIYAMYQAFQCGKPLIERIVTFTGEGLENPRNVVVKVGTPVLEVISFLGGDITDKHILIAGGPMMGDEASTDLVVSAEMNCVLVLDKDEDSTLTRCLRCGKCIAVCPAHICPVLIKDSLDYMDRLLELKSHLCIGCGLCSYICPAKIPVRDYVKKANEKIKGVK